MFFEQNGDTPLHIAAYHGRESVVESLVANGADLMAKTSVRYYAMHTYIRLHTNINTESA